MTGEDKPGAEGEQKDDYNSFRFNSSRWDSASGTYDMGFRNYDPGLNRFLTRDSYGGALNDMALATDPFTGNRYAFAGGNPITFVEIDGHLFGMSLSDLGHAALDVVGLVPVVGEVADVANGIWYAAEGNYADAALSLTSAIPLVGYGATAVKAGKYAKKGIDAADSANDARKTANTADTANDARKTTSKTDSGKNSGGSCPVKQPAPQSFVAGTQVVMADGTLRDIEDLELGDLVLATDVETGESAARLVTDTRDHRGDKHLVTLTVDPDGEDGEAKPGKVTSTDAHLYWLPDYGRWVPAGDLEPGMWLQTSAGTWVQITAVDTAHRTDRVYNLTVEGVHSYYVSLGSADLLVHNQCGTKVKYGDDDLSKKAIEYRKKNGYVKGGRNVAVIEYKIGDKVDHVIAISKGGKKKNGAGHAEQRAWQELQQKHPGIQPDQVSRVYTELAPCDYNGCDNWLRSTFGGNKVSWSIDYPHGQGPASKAGRSAGINELKRMLTQIRRGKL